MKTAYSLFNHFSQLSVTFDQTETPTKATTSTRLNIKQLLTREHARNICGLGL